ncbi:hypothetical protein [Roseimicrobium sp. ORNL1]|uniref:hypothetical protein n=1 Tax=Roseimicrobium sp. ORNL1 TaxID=2711231 RepID=UPI0013E1B31E|nr:hypothetical protein [Roseimicrobium sp. ORNL1]QIF05362.1 hypothetical protein G5S37_28940 [Roseimicrobium sp. ORNL1]
MKEAEKSSRQQSCIRIGCLAVLGLGALLFIVVFVQYRYTPFNYFPAEVVEALQTDPEATLFSINPLSDAGDSNDSLRNHRIYGKTVLSSAADRASLVNVLTESTRGAWEGAACFDPRHALRATGPKGTYDLVICFGCGQVHVYHPDGRKQLVFIRASSDKYNSYLTARDVPLPDQ